MPECLSTVTTRFEHVPTMPSPFPPRLDLNTTNPHDAFYSSPYLRVLDQQVVRNSNDVVQKVKRPDEPPAIAQQDTRDLRYQGPELSPSEPEIRHHRLHSRNAIRSRKTCRSNSSSHSQSSKHFFRNIYGAILRLFIRRLEGGHSIILPHFKFIST